MQDTRHVIYGNKCHPFGASLFMHKPDLKSPQSKEVYTRKSFLVPSAIAEIVGCPNPKPNHNMVTTIESTYPLSTKIGIPVILEMK
jgi:hypothetical protein